jgi:hypothetical protein
MNWIISHNREKAELNLQRINHVFMDKVGYPYLQSVFQVGHVNIDNHPHFYIPNPTEEILEPYNISEADLVNKLLIDEISETDPAFVDTYPRIWDLCLSELRGREPKEIEYKKQLLDGESLYQSLSFTDDGFLSTAKYYANYQDIQNLGDLTIETQETYVTNPSQSGLFPSQREPVSRNKIWTYYNLDGTVYKTYSKPKVYDTRPKKAAEGEQRRTNIVNILVDNVGLAGVLSGVFSTPEDANVKLTSLLQSHSVALGNNYIKTGRGTIYDDIASDSTHAWLDMTVADNVGTNIYCAWMIGKTFREYVTLKLQGNIK